MPRTHMTLANFALICTAVAPGCSAFAKSGSIPAMPLPAAAAKGGNSLASPLPLFRIAQAEKPEDIAAGNPVLAPLKWNGLWVSKSGDGELHCTAQFVAPRVLMTAAHCVRSQTGSWYADTKASLFLLQYQNESWSKPYKPLNIYIPRQWRIELRFGEDPENPKTMTRRRQQEYSRAVTNNLQYDYAFICVNGESITGHYSLHTNEHWQTATTVGYPGAVMGGAVIQKHIGQILDEISADKNRLVPNEQGLLQTDAYFTKGASGGAWVGNFSVDEKPDTNIVVGLNSVVVPDNPGAIYGPKLNDTVIQILNFTATNCH